MRKIDDTLKKLFILCAMLCIGELKTQAEEFSIRIMSYNIYRGDNLAELAELLTWSYTALTTNISSTVIANRSNT